MNSMKYISIEPALFGDAWVGLYDERDDLLLDKKYFAPTLEAAYFTARELQRKIEKEDGYRFDIRQYAVNGAYVTL